MKSKVMKSKEMCTVLTIKAQYPMLIKLKHINESWNKWDSMKKERFQNAFYNNYSVL